MHCFLWLDCDPPADCMRLVGQTRNLQSEVALESCAVLATAVGLLVQNHGWTLCQIPSPSVMDGLHVLILAFLSPKPGAVVLLIPSAAVAAPSWPIPSGAVAAPPLLIPSGVWVGKHERSPSDSVVAHRLVPIPSGSVAEHLWLSHDDDHGLMVGCLTVDALWLILGWKCARTGLMHCILLAMKQHQSHEYLAHGSDGHCQVPLFQ